MLMQKWSITRKERMTRYSENKKIFNFKQLLLVLYLSFVIFSQIFIYLDNIFVYIISLIIVLSLVIPLSMLIINAETDFVIKQEIRTKNEEQKNFIINFLIILTLGLIIYNAKAISGKNVYEADFLWALQQARDNSYVEFSSPLFVLIFAKIPTLIADNPIFISTCYILIRSLVVSYVITKLSIRARVSHCCLPTRMLSWHIVAIR